MYAAFALALLSLLSCSREVPTSEKIVQFQNRWWKSKVFKDCFYLDSDTNDLITVNDGYLADWEFEAPNTYHVDMYTISVYAAEDECWELVVERFLVGETVCACPEAIGQAILEEEY